MTDQRLDDMEERLKRLMTTCAYKAFTDAFKESLVLIQEYKALKKEIEAHKSVAKQ